MNIEILSRLTTMVNKAEQQSVANHDNMQKMIDQAVERSRQMAYLVDILCAGTEQSTTGTCKIIRMIPRYTQSNNIRTGNPIRINLTDYQLRKSL